jgi:hypothetical protein
VDNEAYTSTSRSGGGSSNSRGGNSNSSNHLAATTTATASGRSTSTNSNHSNTSNSNNTHPAATTSSSSIPHDPLLDLYERRLQTSIDSDFFYDPTEFQALNRIIDIIHAEISNHGGNITAGSIIRTDNFSHLPTYQNIVNQRKIVEEAIEHMAVKHCADLNSSVAAVGRMSRQFDEAKLRVRNLRRQVRDVKDSLKLGDFGVGGVDDGGVSNEIGMIHLVDSSLIYSIHNLTPPEFLYI